MQAQLAWLSAIWAPVPHPNQPGTDPVQAVTNNTLANVEAPAQQATSQQMLFMDKAEAEQAQAQLLAHAMEDSLSKRAALLDIVPGFKASLLSLSKCTFSIHSLSLDWVFLPMEHIRSVSCSCFRWGNGLIPMSWRLIFTCQSYGLSFIGLEA